MPATMITGGGGFCGLNIAEHLLGQGRRVVLYGVDEPPAQALAALRTLPGVLLVEQGDVRDQAALKQAMARHDVDELVHAAAITASLQTEQRAAARILDVNLLGTIAVLEAALGRGVRRLVCLSSGVVFGSRVKKEGLLDEDRDIPVPESLYAISKYAAERAALRYRQSRGLDVVVLRVGTAFGRWEYSSGVRDTLSVPYSLWHMARQGKEAVFTSELPTDWVYGDDVAQAVSLLLQAASCRHGLYQVATGASWSVPQWCDLLQTEFPAFVYRCTSCRGQANVGVPAPTVRPPFSVARLEQEFGYKAQYREQAAFDDYMQWRLGYPDW
ncbi:NAD-dependent epimerase/dehydratase family protein [Alcaligenes sp. Marseille-Q7550]